MIGIYEFNYAISFYNMIFDKVMSNIYMFSPRMHDWVPSCWQKQKTSQMLKQDFDDDKRSLKAIWKSI